MRQGLAAAKGRLTGFFVRDRENADLQIVFADNFLSSFQFFCTSGADSSIKIAIVVPLNLLITSGETVVLVSIILFCLFQNCDE